MKMYRQINNLALRVIFTIGAFSIASLSAQVFSDSFDTSQGSTFTTSGAIGTSAWSVTRAGDDWGARIDGGILELTNNASAAARANGWVYAHTATSGFDSPYDAVLENNTDLLTWTFNMQQIRTNPAGFNSTNSYGVAFVIGSTSTTVASSGDGYAIVLGNTGSPDPIRFVSFTGGIQSLGLATGGLITATAPLDDPTDNYMSLSLAYDPSNHQWQLFGRNDGATNFADPTSGTLTLLGTVTDSTYTGTNLTSLGAYWQGSTAENQTSFFDNIRVDVSDGLYWDTNGTTSGTGGTGNWNTTDTHFNPSFLGTHTVEAWDNASNEKVTFGGTAGTVTLTEGITSNGGIVFESDGYTLAGASALTLGASNQTITVSDAAHTATLSAAIAGSNGLTKAGAGTLTLSGTNTYTGDTTLNAGTLKLNGSSITGNTIVNAGVLQIAHENSDLANLEMNGGTLQFVDNLGAGQKTFNFGGLTLNADSIIDFGNHADGVILNFSSLTYNGGNLHIYNWSGNYKVGGGLDRLIIGGSLGQNALEHLFFYNGAGTGLWGDGRDPWQLGVGGEVVPVPEPSTWLGIGGLLLLIGIRERKRLVILLRKR